MRQVKKVLRTARTRTNCRERAGAYSNFANRSILINRPKIIRFFEQSSDNRTINYILFYFPICQRTINKKSQSDYGLAFFTHLKYNLSNPM